MNITPNSTFTAPSPTSNKANIIGTLIALGFVAIGVVLLHTATKKIRVKNYKDI